MIGTTLAGTYRIERRVAEGGMGRLYEGRHTRLQMTVAVKTLRELRGGRPEAIARAEREARAMASIVSPHVARVLDLVRTPDGRPCLVTELLEGEDLEQRLARDGKLPAREAARIARDVARGLAVAHAAGVLHRDIKPSNVFLTRDGQVKLLDFGVAKLEDTEALTHAGAFLGTPAYMSPEQASSASDVDERSDVYGLGAILYEMLGGQRPYGDLDTTQTLTRLLRGEPPRLTALERSVPEGLASVVEHAMSRERDDRFAGAAEMADALVPWADGGEARRSERSARWLRPEAVGAVLTASLLAGLWAAALLYEVGRVVDAFETWPAWALGVGRAVPAAALAVALALGVRSLVRRWRSAPRVGALLTGLRRTVWIAAAALGALEAGRLAARLYELRTPMGRSEETVVALGLAAGVAMVAAAVTARLGARRPAERADG
ncbi:MAG TPA: serine/threonine-protein kinase [Sandaracinaceae bacterium LLY-WYZ-13_1]|nr:serine/threonine-protein kinase [Sandaracinaceae bacterium LLY-WYZ-13_1]